jgi:hypothetical protein
VFCCWECGGTGVDAHLPGEPLIVRAGDDGVILHTVDGVDVFDGDDVVRVCGGCRTLKERRRGRH